jgi:hypothetical protein
MSQTVNQLGLNAPIISDEYRRSHPPTPDVIEIVPIETQLSINTNQSNRNHLPIPDPIETQLPIEIVEPQRSRPPTPDTIASVDGQQKGIRSNSSPSTTNIIIFCPFLMTTAALLILRTIFPFMYMNPQHRRLCVGLCRMLILFAIYFKHLPLLMNSREGAMVFLHFFC